MEISKISPGQKVPSACNGMPEASTSFASIVPDSCMSGLEFAASLACAWDFSTSHVFVSESE